VAGLLAGCNGGDHHPAPSRTTGAATVRLVTPVELGEPQRPAVEFHHAVHVTALEREGCDACHDRDEKKRVLPWLVRMEAAEDLDQVMESYHDKCIGCHQDRLDRDLRAGPVQCGLCHLELEPATSEWREIRWDYSLHARHVISEGNKCDGCHHVKDESGAGRKVYKQGAESACRDCHGESGQEKRPSLRDASHLMCVNCHLARDGGKTGPSRCKGCHDAGQLGRIEQLATVPRLMRGQKDQIWVHTEGGKLNLVPFDHEAHEPRTRSCSDCHHRTLDACGKCHTRAPGEQGGYVSLEQAYHASGSARSCVGCHQARIEQRADCWGCHHLLVDVPSRQACRICHSGPRPEQQGTESPAEALAKLPPGLAAYSMEGFPDKVVIQGLANEFKPSVVPHKDVAAYFDGVIGKSALASRFHGHNRVPCAACHHRGPAGERPPPCGSCHHASVPDPLRDKPELKVAYHRQCIGCHLIMGVGTACADCHARADGGEKP
jgi:hypothetical protein